MLLERVAVQSDITCAYSNRCRANAAAPAAPAAAEKEEEQEMLTSQGEQ